MIVVKEIFPGHVNSRGDVATFLDLSEAGQKKIVPNLISMDKSR